MSGPTWSSKRSVLQYAARMPDGECSVTDGVRVADRVPPVTFVLAPGEEPEARGVAARLTPEGVELFNEVHPAGEPFDDLTFPRPPRATPADALPRDRGDLR